MEPVSFRVFRSDDRLWINVQDAGAVGTVRRAALTVAAELSLPARRTAELAIVATELASNLHRHADEGVALVRAVRRAGTAGVELLAIDKGPGMHDLAASMRDGRSTAGTLGIGLGSVLRKADEVDAYSRPGRGTIIAATIWPGPPPVGDPAHTRAAGVSRPMSGEDVNGDSYGARSIDGGMQLMVCDGLGHGPLAAHAAMVATSAFCDGPPGSPSLALKHVHEHVRHTRGVVVTVVELRVGAPFVTFAGLGNVGGAVVTGSGQHHSLVAQPGIAGHRLPTVRERRAVFPPGSALILHSDGLTDRWDLRDYPGLMDRSPVLIAATLLRDAGVRRDDAAVLAAKGSPL